MSFANNSLIVALDVPTEAEARRIFDQLRATGCAFKIGLQLFTKAGSNFVRELIKHDARVFLDLKFHDIPNTVANAAIEVARLGVWMFNVHASGGREMMERSVDAVRETVARENMSQPKIIAVTVLTSSNEKTLQTIGINQKPLHQVLNLSQLTVQCGLDGVVASAQEASAIRENVKDKNFLIVTPGIRLKFSVSNDDQKRVVTPAEAIESGADYIVIGRPILESANPAATVEAILHDLKAIN